MTVTADNPKAQSIADLQPIGSALDDTLAAITAPNLLYQRTPAEYALPPINSPGAYLRHRSASVRAQRAARRRLWLRRLVVLAVAAFLYLAIGRDTVEMARAAYSTNRTQLRHDLHGSADASGGTPQASADDARPRP